MYKVPTTCALKLENTTIYSTFTLPLELKLKHCIWKDTSIQEFQIAEEDIDKTKKSLPKSHHNRPHISKIDKHKQRWFSIKPISIAASALTALVSTGAMAIVTRTILLLLNCQNATHCENVNKTLSD